MSYKIESNIFMPDNVIGTNTNTGVGAPVSTGSGTSPVVKKPDIKEIFKAGLTRAQAAEYGNEVLQMFDTYNKADANGNKDDVIDENEFKAYQKGELGIEEEPVSQDVKGKTRTAPGGVYTVVKGDTLSKIANDFGISLVALYNNNRSVIGNNMNLIEIGMQLHIKGTGSTTSPNPTQTKKTTTSTTSAESESSDKTETQKTEDKNLKDVLTDYFKEQKTQSPPKIFAGMTREQAEKRGEETLKLFEQYAGEGADKIEQAKFNEYKKTLTTKSVGSIMEELPSVIGKKGNEMTAKDMGTVLGVMVEEGSVKTGIGRTKAGIETSEKVSEMILKHDVAMSGNPTKEEIKQHASELMLEIKTSAQEEIKNKGNLYKTHYERLKRGEFTEFEKACGLQAGDELTEEQIEKLTITAVKAEHIYPVLKTLADAMQHQGEDGSKDNHIMLLIMDLGNQFFENQDVIAIAQMTGLRAVIDQAKQQFAANHIAETSSIELEEMDTETAALYTATLADIADAESFQKFAENHADSIDLINEVVKTVIQNSSDETKNNALRQAINNANAKVGYSETTTNDRRTNTPSSAYTTNSIRSESERYYANLGLAEPQTVEEAERLDSRRSVNRLKSEEGPAPIVYNPARIRQLARDYNNSIGKFDTLSPEDQAAIRKYLENAMGQPQAIISIMLAGNEKVQLFLVKEKYITIEDIERNVKSFPSNFDGFSDLIKESLYKSVKESVNAGTLKPEQMTDGERKMYEFGSKRED